MEIMKNGIRVFTSILLISVFFTSCFKEDNVVEEKEEKEKEDKVGVLGSIKFLSSDNTFLAYDITTEIDEENKEVIAEINVLKSTTEFGDNLNLIAKVEILDNPNTFSKQITIEPNASEVPLDFAFVNGEKIKYTFKPKVNFINKDLVSVVNPQDLVALYEISKDLPEEYFAGIDFATIDPAMFTIALQNIKNGLATANQMFGVTGTDVTTVNFSKIILANTPDSVFKLEELKELILSDTQIKSLPDDLGELVNLETLYIEGTGVQQIPDAIGNLTKLTTLSVSRGPLLVISPELKKCTEMRKLYLYQNSQLTEMPEAIGYMTKLEVLNMRYCKKISSIIPEIGTLKNLEKLDLRYLVLVKELPSSIGGCDNLRELILINNDLLALPDEIGMLKKCTKLEISRNRNMKIITPKIGDMTSLITLQAYDMDKLEAIPREIGGCVNLKTLNFKKKETEAKVAMNKKVPMELQTLTELNVLNLQNCGLTGFEYELALTKMSLSRLNLSLNPQLKIKDKDVQEFINERIGQKFLDEGIFN